jgi:FkbM family methyltransferase
MSEIVDRDFSQYGEQAIILDFIDKHGGTPRICVDVGAYEGVIGSNSRALFLQGWSGLVIEPDPRSFARLQQLYANRADIKKLRRAISDRTGIRRMQFCNGPPGTAPEDAWKYAQVNTFSIPFSDTYRRDHNYEYKRSWVRVTTIKRALRWAGIDPGNIGFMSVDCEGEDLKIIESLDFVSCRPHLLCIESDNDSRPVFSALVSRFGYSEYGRTAANTIYCRLPAG